MNLDVINKSSSKREGPGRPPDSGWPQYMKSSKDHRKLMPGVVRKTQIVKEMNERHHEIARMVLLGYKNIEIAKILNITKECVCAIRNAPPVKEQVAILAGARDAQTVDVAKQIQVALPKCIKYLDGTIEDDEISDGLRSRNAFGLMAIGGHGPVKNVNVKGIHAVLTADDIREIRENAETIAVEVGLVQEEV